MTVPGSNTMVGSSTPETTVPTGPGVGTTQTLSASQNLSAGGVESAEVNITLNEVLDPSTVDYGGSSPSGSRAVAINVTIANEGSVTLPAVGEGDEYVLSLEWALDPQIGNSDNIPSYQFEGLPSSTCQGTAEDFTSGLAPGQTITGCVLFPGVPASVDVTAVSADLLFAGLNRSTPKIWNVSDDLTP